VLEVDESNLGGTDWGEDESNLGVDESDQLALSLSVDLLKLTEWGETDFSFLLFIHQC
jgi:hypothetical protein